MNTDAVHTVRAEERQMNLILALRSTYTGLLAQEIIANVAGYDAENKQSAKRMFERDKSELRNLGVPITVTGEGDCMRYRINTAEYDLAPLHLNPQQLAALELAASAWRDGSLPVTARRALMKLRAVSTAGREMLNLSVDLAGRELPSPLVNAVEERRIVAFDYYSASTDRTKRRVVHPYQLYLTAGAWYLRAFDVSAQQMRTFRLARVQGKIEICSEPGAFEKNISDDNFAPKQAVLAVNPGSCLQLRMRDKQQDLDLKQKYKTLNRDILIVEYEDLYAFAGYLAACGSAVVVLEPDELALLVKEHLAGVTALTANTSGNEKE